MRIPNRHFPTWKIQVPPRNLHHFPSSIVQIPSAYNHQTPRIGHASGLEISCPLAHAFHSHSHTTTTLCRSTLWQIRSPVFLFLGLLGYDAMDLLGSNFYRYEILSQPNVSVSWSPTPYFPIFQTEQASTVRVALIIN